MPLLNKEEIKYLVFDIESVPDSRLIKLVKYPALEVDDVTAVKKFQEEILVNSDGASYFIPVTFQYPVAVCVAKVRDDLRLSDVVILDAPTYRPREMVRLFWHGVENLYAEATLVSFNGRGFDIPLLELMAFRYGIPLKRHLRDKFGTRYRFGTRHVDLHDWLSNFGAIKVQGGLNLLAKVLGKPGKMKTTGDEVYDMFREGRLQEINDYCVHDVLDTYFVFLRTRMILGEMSIAKEQELVRAARDFLADNRERTPAFGSYLQNWGDWDPWP